MKKIPMIAALVFCLGLPMAASAKTLKNKFGIGGEVMGGAATGGLSLKYWFGMVGLQLITGIESRSPENADSQLNFDIGLRILGNIARARDTNLFAGAGFLMRIVDLGGNIDSEVNKDIEIMLGVEHFFGDHFSVYGRVDLRIALDETTPGNGAAGSSVTFGRGQTMGWGGGFTFYF